ncbi:MAG: hypothetical protein NW202_13440 [Nitrospira sp.]|nr:hypothetical protein [Nitrospira sp.]
MAPKGSLGLPPLLDARRLKYGIPNGAFKQHMAFDWVMLWQIPSFEADDGTYGDTGLYLPDTGRAKKAEEAPRAILVSAGIAALDNLRSNGIDLGHIVGFVKHAPFRKPVELLRGHELYAIICRDGDLVDSEDLAEAVTRGEVSIQRQSFPQPNGSVVEKHVFIDKGGKQWEPKIPWIADDY